MHPDGQAGRIKLIKGLLLFFENHSAAIRAQSNLVRAHPCDDRKRSVLSAGKLEIHSDVGFLLSEPFRWQHKRQNRISVF